MGPKLRDQSWSAVWPLWSQRSLCRVASSKACWMSNGFSSQEMVEE